MAFSKSTTNLARCLKRSLTLPWTRIVVAQTSALGVHNRRTACSSASDGGKSLPSLYKFVVVGGGAGGLAMASSLSRQHGKGQVAVIEPSDDHFYQPMWTLVGGGVKKKANSRKAMKDLMPSRCDWIKEKAVVFDPDSNIVKTEGGRSLHYYYLIVAMGIQLNFDKLTGLREALDNDPMVGCNYTFDTVEKTFNAINNFKGGNAIFTFPNTPLKCPGAPQKIMYLAEEYFREHNKRDKAKVRYFTPLSVIFSAPKYAAAMLKVCKARDIEVNFFHNLIEIKSNSKEAVFQKLNSDTNETVTIPYEMMHVPPPMGAPDVLKSSPLAGPAGFLSVNKETGQHTKYPNVFGIGDCTDMPTPKTAAAVAAQSGILRKTVDDVINGRTPNSKYDGYTSCPLVTGRRSCVLAEFDYNFEALETFPLIDQGKESRAAYHLKADFMPELYWYGLLKGMWHGPGTFRKLMHLGFSK